MTRNRWAKFWGKPSRRYSDLGMHVYWLVVTIISVAMLSATVNIATPRDAADLAAAKVLAN
jgi:hypothetical protein